ncbi:MAG TPA: flagellar biosynthetic protein FliR [Bdellovibrionales bacterium]|nr:flagellar biosynthetic protein FliR [Bdellovibrionales bacterium]
MFEIYKFNQAEILTFILVMLRISVFLVSWPVFSSGNVPAPVKVLLGLVLSIVMFPAIGHERLSAAELERFYIWLMMREAFIGLALGFLARFFFFAISICAQIASDSIGLSSVQLLNPTTNDRSSAIEEFYTILGTLFFLGLNGHHIFISGLAKSYEILPVSLNALNMAALGSAGALAQSVTVMGLKLSAPVLVSIFCMNLAMGIIGRAVPQINVLVTSMPINILVGFFVLIISIPLLLTGMGELLNQTIAGVFGVLKGF